MSHKSGNGSRTDQSFNKHDQKKNQDQKAVTASLESRGTGSSYNAHLSCCCFYSDVSVLVSTLIPLLVSMVSSFLLFQMHISDDVCFCLNFKTGFKMLIFVMSKDLGHLT